MSLYLVLPLIAGLFLSTLAFVVLRRDYKSFDHQIFASMLLCAAVWGFTILGMRASPDLEHALSWEKAVLVMIDATSVLLYHFSLSYTGNKSRRVLRLAYVFLFTIVILAPTDLVIGGMQLKSYGYAPVPGPLFLFPHLFGAYLLVLLAVVNFVKGYRASNVYEVRNRYLYIIIAVGIAIIGAAFDIFPVFGLPLYPGAIIGNTIFAILASIAMLRYHLLDIHVVIRKSIAYSLISAVVAIPYAGIILLFANILKTQEISPWIYLVMLIILALLLQPLWSRVQRLVDRLFYRGRYDHLRTLQQFSQGTKDITNLEHLADSLIKLVSQAMQASRSCLLLQDPKGSRFTVVSSNGLALDSKLTFTTNGVLVRWLSQHTEFLERRELDIIPQLQGVTMRERDALNEVEAELLISMKTVRGLIGMLILGRKLSGEAYSEDDIKLLMVASHQIATSLDNARLYQESRQAYEELKEAQERLIWSERLKALGEMTSGIAHDFNNILTTILGRAQLTLRKVSDEKVKYNLKLIDEAAQDAASMVRRLQDFARVRTDHSTSATDLNEVVRSALEMIKPRLDEQCETLGSDIAVTVDLGKIRPVKGNAPEFREALINILINAIQAMPHGGTLTVSTRQDNNMVAISVCDTGIGMSDEVRNRVFEPFFTTKGQRGLGMGLSVVYGTIKRHKGDISVSSEPGKGSTFTIRLPVAQKDKEHAVEPHQNSVKSKAILVVDDDQGCCDILYEVLTEAGHTVDIATSGSEGLSLAQQKDYDLVITDLGMPNMSGRDLASALKTTNPEIQVVLVTGWGVQLDVAALAEQGIGGVIAKPFSEADVLAVTDQLLRSRI